VFTVVKVTPTLDYGFVFSNMPSWCPVPLLSVLIPCYNESTTLHALVERVLAAPPADIPKELVIVDDASTDGSREVLIELARERPEIKAFFHEKNQGKGAAIRTAQKACTGDIVIIQDADLECNPDHYPDLIAPIRCGRADVVYGSRFSGGRPRRVPSLGHLLKNRLLTLISNLATNLSITDMETCYKAFYGPFFRAIPIRSNRFGIEPELTAKVANLGLRVFEVPIDYEARIYDVGKKIGWKDGLSALFTIARYGLTDAFLKGVDEGIVDPLAMRRAQRFNAWMFMRMKPYVGQRVLVLGSGVGQVMLHMLDRKLVVAGGSNPLYIDRVRGLFAGNPNVRAECFDPANSAGDKHFQDDRLDTVICVNALERAERDQEMLRFFHEVLAPGGRLLLLVPNCSGYYGTLDASIGNRRRYRRNELIEKMSSAGFAVEKVFGLNHAGALGWFINSRILRFKMSPAGRVTVSNSLVPLVRFLDRLLPIPALSLMAVGKKPDADVGHSAVRN
jgi:glycosyltransferase involved in cell wall biosynthesis